ncbi:protein IQ-DOMAIN 14 [Capsicum galapagoense]
MAESSSSRITITLGRSGQVVKKAGPVLDHPLPDSGPAVGSKRSVRDRLGTISDSTTEFNNKRQRGDGSRLGSRASSGIDGNNFTASPLYVHVCCLSNQIHDCKFYSLLFNEDGRLGKDDLRYKIMRKTALDRVQSNGQQNGVDLRDFLSRPAQSSTESPSSRHDIPDQRDNRPRVPEPRDSRPRVPEPRASRPRVPELRDSRARVPEPRNTRPRVPEPRNDRHHMVDSRGSRQYLPDDVDSIPYMPETRDFRGHRPELKDVRYNTPESRSLSMVVRAPATRNAEALPLMDSIRNSYSPWTLDRLRRRSPDGVRSSSRGISPPRRGEELQRRPQVTPYDDLRFCSYTRKDVSELSGPTTSAGYLSNTSQPAGPGKTVTPLRSLIPQSRNQVQRSSYAAEDQPTVDSFLNSLGLEKYAIHFKAEEVDLYSLKQMGDNDLKELGVPMGPRKKILLALAARARRQV